MSKDGEPMTTKYPYFYYAKQEYDNILIGSYKGSDLAQQNVKLINIISKLERDIRGYQCKEAEMLKEIDALKLNQKS